MIFLRFACHSFFSLYSQKGIQVSKHEGEVIVQRKINMLFPIVKDTKLRKKPWWWGVIGKKIKPVQDQKNILKQEVV